MAEKLEDFNLPITVINRIIKEGLTANLNTAKDARTALARASSVFILYLTSQATQMAMKQNRKTLVGQDILMALEELEFDDLVRPVRAALLEFKESSKKKTNKNKTSPEEEDEVIVIEDEEN